MDIRLSETPPTPEERVAVDSVLGSPDSGWQGGERRADLDGHFALGGHAVRSERHRLLPVLHAIQNRLGWIAPGALNYACRRLDIPPAEAYGVASFYGLFSVVPRPPQVLHVCDDITCLARGAARVCKGVENLLGPPGSPALGGKATWYRSPCLGMCERAPAAMITAASKNPREKICAPADAKAMVSALKISGTKTLSGPPDTLDISASVPQAGQAGLMLLGRIGQADPESIDDYRAHGGYEALRRAIAMGRDWVVREVSLSRLVGRGGAAFPTGKKWNPANHPYYLVCNADESEPGTFKDRVIMEGDPFSLIEAMTVAAYATGCEQGFIYLRGEYPLAGERLAHAIESARAKGFLGSNILGKDFHFDIEIRRGAGAYICGEETALFNSIVGFRGEPRNKPPFPTQAGLFGKPTAVNNVETLVNVLPIILDGGASYAKIGTSGSTGPKLFCISGHVRRPGVYEVPFGQTLREIIELAGGVAGNGELQAALLGGAAGTFVSPAELDTPLTFEGARAIGATIGSGAVVVFDDTVDLRKILLRIAAFFHDESCGQCVPCRVGTVRQEELLRRLCSGHPEGSVDEEIALLKEIGQVMKDASICGLGQTASSAAESALRRWELFLREKV